MSGQEKKEKKKKKQKGKYLYNIEYTRVHTTVIGDVEMVKIKGKVWKTGNSYVMSVPKALVESEVLEEGKCYEFELNKEWYHCNHYDLPPDTIHYKLHSLNFPKLRRYSLMLSKCLNSSLKSGLRVSITTNPSEGSPSCSLFSGVSNSALVSLVFFRPIPNTYM